MWMNPTTFTPGQLSEFLDRETHPTAVFYSQDGLLKSAQNEKLDFVSQIGELLIEFGFHCILVDGENLAAPLLNSNASFHFWMIERPPVCAENQTLFHVFPAYLHGFWYCDRAGIRNNSSIRSAPFRPQKMSGQWAKKVFATLRERFVKTGRTKFQQSAQGKHPPPDGCFVIPVQGFSKPEYYETWIQYPDLIREVIRHRNGRPVAIKPHPLQGARDSRFLMDFHDPANGVYVAPFNLHELLSVAHCVVTRCSAVAVEAMLHKVPAVVSGEVDFQHCVQSVRDVDDLQSAIHSATNGHIPYEKFLTWFFTQQLFQPRNRQKTRERLQEQFGLRSGETAS